MDTFTLSGKFIRNPGQLSIPFSAERYFVTNQSPLPMGSHLLDDKPGLYVKTIQGREVEVTLGDWIIQEPDGIHYYPCQDSIFRERYIPAYQNGRLISIDQVIYMESFDDSFPLLSIYNDGSDNYECLTISKKNYLSVISTIANWARKYQEELK